MNEMNCIEMKQNKTKREPRVISFSFCCSVRGFIYTTLHCT